MPEIPEIQAHAERIESDFAGHRLKQFVPIKFTTLKTVAPAPDVAYGSPLESVGRRGKYMLLRFEPVTFVVHLMQGGRLLPDERPMSKPRGALARFVFEDGHGLLLTEAGTERRAGVWCVEGEGEGQPPLDKLGPEAAEIEPGAMLAAFRRKSMRLHGFLRDQRQIAGVGRRLANEVCHRAKLSPFAMTGKLDAADAEIVVTAMREAIAEGLAEERQRDSMSASKERPSRVHKRTGEPCPVCGDTIRAVEYSSYTVNYCPTCQTGGKLLADNTTSKFLK
jgi:formamidopyrimidine-DNA glycosylase